MRTSTTRVYADNSVYGGIVDPEFDEASRAFFDQVRSGRFLLVTSALIEVEIEFAPPPVRALYEELIERAEFVSISDEALELQRAYLETGIVTWHWAADALHVALASVARCTILVSWNFRHIVHFKKIPLYNAINTVNGYPEIAIHSPQEVINYEE